LHLNNQRGKVTEKEFVAYWTSRLCNERLKSFPEDFSPETETEVVTLPGVNLLKGEELFGSYEIVDSRGIRSILLKAWHGLSTYSTAADLKRILSVYP
jgi:hypothetical protein